MTTTELNMLLNDLRAAAPEGYAVGLHIRFAAPLVTAHTYDEKWLKHYTDNAYGLRDPLIGWGLSMEGTSRWSELEIPDPFDIMGQAVSFGLRFGCAVACGPVTSRSIVGCARADREFTDAEIAHIQTLVLAMHEIAKPPTELTKAQIEALQRIADGDRHAAASAKLGISESAFKARLTSARERLMARTTTEAVQKAREYRLM